MSSSVDVPLTAFHGLRFVLPSKFFVSTLQLPHTLGIGHRQYHNFSRTLAHLSTAQCPPSHASSTMSSPTAMIHLCIYSNWRHQHLTVIESTADTVPMTQTVPTPPTVWQTPQIAPLFAVQISSSLHPPAPPCRSRLIWLLSCIKTLEIYPVSLPLLSTTHIPSPASVSCSFLTTLVTLPSGFMPGSIWRQDHGSVGWFTLCHLPPSFIAAELLT